MFLILFLLFGSCKKSNSPGSGQSNNRPPAITSIGTPVGSPFTKNIGASGGSLASPDGRLQLDIPSGALAGNTDICIQPVTNESPGGVGLAYQLLPEGIAFNNPVTLTYHYTKAEINGSHPFFFYIAFQDSVGIWHADRKNRDLDTVVQTISLTSTHFSTWSLIDNVKLSAPQTDFKQNETNFIQVVEVLGESQSQGNDELASLPPISSLPDNIVSNWKINGKSNSLVADGKINGAGAKVNYIAPAQIKAKRIVQVSVQVKYHLIVYNKGKKVAEFNNFILFLDLTLLTNEHNYGLKLEIGEGLLDVTSYAWSYTYTDQATMDIHISGNDATVSNIVNYP